MGARLDGGAKILVVDDDRTMRLMLRSALERDGYAVTEAADGIQALDQFLQAQPDIILMDAAMPELDGFAACASLQRLPGGRDIPILMITGLNDDSSVERAFTSGATDFITKPVNWAVLRQRVRRMVNERRAERHVNYLAYHDSLTGLPNRTLFVERLEHGLARARRAGSRLAVMFLDLDGFKLVNDTMGHDVGDQLLRAVAERLVACLRESDTVARLGGDEFTAILNDIEGESQVNTAARRVLNALTAPVHLGERELFVGASIGIAVYPNDGEDVRTLLRSADMAMYRAKDAGRNHFRFYTSDMGDRAQRRMMLESRLRGALERGEFTMHYQPIADLATGQLASLEALVRWEHPELGLVSPGEFIPLAEETGIIGPLGAWIFGAVCSQMGAWVRQGCAPPRVSINLSGRQFNDPDLVQQLVEGLAGAGISPDRIVLEITENTVMHNAEASVQMLRELKRLGFGLAVDDFGTGYSSLGYLKRFPLDALKIDRSFVHGTPGDADDSAIVQAIVALAHGLRLQVVAEGVETDAHLEFLCSLGCDFAQGYHLGRPVGVEATTALLERGEPLIASPRSPGRDAPRIVTALG